MTLAELATPLALGAVGWIIAEFIGRPVREFFLLRRKIRLQILTLADARNALWETGESISDDNRRTQQRALREMGARAMAFGDTERLARMLLRFWNLRPSPAGRAVIRFADAIEKGDREYDAALRAVNRALKFPRTRRR